MLVALFTAAFTGHPTVLFLLLPVTFVNRTRLAQNADAHVALWVDEDIGELTLNRCPFGFEIGVMMTVELQLVEDRNGPALRFIHASGAPKLVPCAELEGEPEDLKREIGGYINSQSGYLKF